MELENRIAMAPTCRRQRIATGHAWTADAVLRARDHEIERALWTAIRSLEEKAKLSRKLAERIGATSLGAVHASAAEEAERAMTVLSKHLAEPIPPPGGHLDE